MEWSAPAILVACTPFGEADALATVFTEEHGIHRGLARGAQSRTRAAIWQAGNLLEVSWTGRLSEQLGSLKGDLVHPAAALAMADPLTLSVLLAACAVAEGALPEREPHPRAFRGMLHLIAHLGEGPAGIAALVAWEAGLLADLGFGLDLTRCAVTGGAQDLAYVSPKTGRAVCAGAAAPWEARLLRLPRFLLGDSRPNISDLLAGLALTGHFLARDAFGARHKGLPAARIMLSDRISRM